MKMSDNRAKHEVLIKQYLRSILDISGNLGMTHFVPEESSPFGKISIF